MVTNQEDDQTKDIEAYRRQQEIKLALLKKTGWKSQEPTPKITPKMNMNNSLLQVLSKVNSSLDKAE